jgi:hypothetical protein
MGCGKRFIAFYIYSAIWKGQCVALNIHILPFYARRYSAAYCRAKRHASGRHSYAARKLFESTVQSVGNF